MPATARPRVCQTLISGMWSVVHDRPGPVHSPSLILFCGTMMGLSIKDSNTLISMHNAHSELQSLLVYPAIGSIINSFFYNTGAWQPPKSPSWHQRSWSCSTTSSPAEPKLHIWPSFLLLVRIFSKEHYGKVGRQQINVQETNLNR